MINTLDVRTYRDLYGRLDNAPAGSGAAEIREAVDAAEKAVRALWCEREFFVDGQDDCEAFVGALTWFFLQSNPSYRAAVPAPDASEA